MPLENLVVATASVARAERLSPHFARIWFTAPEFEAFGTPGETFDQRIKIIVPDAGGRLPELPRDGDWWAAWCALPEDERGCMRTYSIRDIVPDDDGRTLVAVDFVLHADAGAPGPAAAWASAAEPGSRVVIVGPRRGRGYGGIEFRPGDASRVLLAGDETAAPAIARILADVGPEYVGDAFIEVPVEADELAMTVPDGWRVTWLARDGADHGTQLVPAVLEHLHTRQKEPIRDVPTDTPLWETPTYSSLGEELADDDGRPDLYAWIAGESSVVTTIRRHLLGDGGLHRSQVAFMGYWRRSAAS